MTILLKVINTLKIIILKTSFLCNLISSIFLLVNLLNLSIYFESFLDFLQLYLPSIGNIKNAN